MTQIKEEPVYSAFAEIYDRVMRDVDYDSWSQHVLNLAKRYGVKVKKILELACGTGNLALRLRSMGYNLTGLDISEGMLAIARKKLTEAGAPTPLYLAPMQDFSPLGLDRDFDLILNLYDSVNYLLEEDEVVTNFQEAHTHLRAGGLYIFDVTTEYNLFHNFAGYTFAENFEDASYIWENEYNIETKICSSKVTIFLRREGPFNKHVEVHRQKVYTFKWIKQTLIETGFEIVGMFQNLTLKPIEPKCERAHFVCLKGGE